MRASAVPMMEWTDIPSAGALARPTLALTLSWRPGRMGKRDFQSHAGPGSFELYVPDPFKTKVQQAQERLIFCAPGSRKVNPCL